ncbi:alpha/beta hydrolase [Kutzneria sp. CA-103260]|uniref:alpha/beta hydrolase n=1 Tax=Kutzneria sp. CA-103260 TaxID=2802641 RepID=UPI001BAA07EE|nr:alpha/beta fold hydrolase [Kutzneria sp. CA-103260]QUQ63603.1 Esterase EstD [Kutzneria sp. CA-103260]
MTVDIVELLRDGRFAEIHELFAPQLRSLVTPEAIESGWSAVVAQYGAFVSAGPAVTEQGTTRIPLEFSDGRLTLVIVVGPNGLGGLQFAPASAAEPIAPWEPPSYVDVERFDEVPLDDVAGTLSLPRGSGPWPAVVTLSGSGSHDRDETIGRNKPLKDIAWGLASRGIAVLRLDKRPQQVATAYDEYAPAVLAAVRLLRQRKDIGPIYLLGHSLGGTIAPRIAAACTDVAGLILLAGGAQPLHRAMVRQFRHIGAPEATVEAVARQADLVDSPDLSPDTPAAELPFGVPASYWLDLRSYDGPATAAALDLPMLLCQGARDYQVTIADDLARWQAKLADRPNVTIRVYDADNHLFFTGSGPSTPAEYEPAQHVDPEVITDIAAWLAG